MRHTSEFAVNFGEIRLRLSHSSILDDKERVGKANVSDCWAEMESAHQIAFHWMTRLAEDNGLKAFVFPDYVDCSAVEQSVNVQWEHLPEGTKSVWKHDGRGRFVLSSL